MRCKRILAEKRFLKLLYLAVCIGYATPVSACNICTVAFFDYILPPVFVWQFFPIPWFIAACIVSEGDPHLEWVPKTSVGVVIGVGTIFGNAFGFGHSLSLLLIFPMIIFSFKTATRSGREKLGKEQSQKCIAVSVAGGITLIALLCISTLIRTDRTPAQYVLKWGIDGPGHSIIEELKTDPAALDEIRLIVSESNNSASGKLAVTLAERGSPDKDFPILLKALRRAKGKYYRTDIERSLKRLTGFESSPETSADWEKMVKSRKIKIEDLRTDTWKNDKGSSIKITHIPTGVFSYRHNPTNTIVDNPITVRNEMINEVEKKVLKRENSN
ncbi:MAG: hypothetical protein GY795_17205 [Desulfobacterales bacterium]|nr:hypothetical protein [Desulfobacterales bacterium]